jgi:anti-anti-sigma factor
LEIQTEKQGERLLFRLSGTLSEIGAANRFIDFVREHVRPEIQTLVFDLAKASLPDSRFIGRLIQLSQECTLKKMKIYLYYGENKEVENLIKITNLDGIFPMLSHLG